MARIRTINKNKGEGQSKIKRRSFKKDENANQSKGRSFKKQDKSSPSKNSSFNKKEEASPKKGNFSKFTEKVVEKKRRSLKKIEKVKYNKEPRTRKQLYKNQNTELKTKRLAKDNDYKEVRLNKYIANAGICSRREADNLIHVGSIKVNGKVVTEMGFKVKSTDVVQYEDQTLGHEKKVYLLLNKPKDYITTAEDPEGRKTVYDIIGKACRERIYAVGRLDRATTGVLLFTNDGDLTKKLTHPKYGAKKLYHVSLDKKLQHSDMKKISEGIELEDGIAAADAISYAGENMDKKEVGLEIHSGKNRIIRRIFEALGYKVMKLDRVSFAGLTKKNLPRGKWRFLTEKEISYLQMLK